MSEHITDIEQELRTSEIDLFNASTEYRELAIKAADLRAKYDIAWATELLSLKTKMADTKLIKEEKEALALKAVENQFVACRIAEAEAEASKRHLSAIQAIQSSIQTRASLIKSERFATNYQP